MLERVGDIFSQNDADAICVPTNGIVKANGELVMGAGLAKQFKYRCPALPLYLGTFVERTGNHVYAIKCPVNGRVRDVCSFPTKHDWRDNSNIDLIRQSAKELVILADKEAWTHIYLTRVGCGLGGLDWISQVRPILMYIFDDRFTVLTPR